MRQLSCFSVLLLCLTVVATAHLWAQQPTAVVPVEEQGAERIRAALNKTVNWSFKEIPLAEVVVVWQKDLGVPVNIDNAALTAATIDTQFLITKRAEGVSAKAALKTILRDHALAWMIRDEQLTITTKEEADLTLVTRIYPVLDLVQYRDEKGMFQHYDPLIDMIQSTIHPNSWRAGGTGEGTAEPFAGAGAMVVSQTEEVHHAIEPLLAALRTTRKAQGIEGPPPGERPEKPPIGGLGGGGIGGGGVGGGGFGSAGGSGGKGGGIF